MKEYVKFLFEKRGSSHQLITREFLKQYLTEKQNSHFKEVTYARPLLTRSGHYKRDDCIHIHNL